RSSPSASSKYGARSKVYSIDSVAFGATMSFTSSWGPSLTALTVIVTVATVLLSNPVESLALYVKRTSPEKFVGGLYVKAPSGWSVSVPSPSAGLDIRTAVSGSDSGSLSLASTPLAAVTCSVVSSLFSYASSPADGGSVTGVTSIVTMAGS